MSCSAQCKTICIIGILIAVVNAMICSANHLFLDKKIPIPAWFSVASLLGSVVALVCVVRWMKVKSTMK
jgi:hypothetical protein